MGLQPVQLDRRHGTEIQAVDVNGVDETPPELRVARDGAAYQRGPDRLQHLRLGALHDRREGKHVFFLRDRGVWRVAVDDGRQQVVGSPFLDDARDVSMLRGDIDHAGRLKIGVDRLRDGVRRARHGERGQARFGVVWRQGAHTGELVGQGLGDFARVPTRPNSGAVDTAPSAVQENAVDHHVQELFPPIDLIVPQQDLREPGTVRLHRRVAAVPLNRRRAAEDEIPAAALQHRRADIASAGVHRNRLARNARLSEGFGHPIRRPRFLRPRLQHKADLQRDDRQPQCMHARRVRREHEADDGTLNLVADRHPALFSVAAREHVEREAARERREDVAHLGEHERVLLHVRAAEPLGQAGARRLRADEFIGRLSPVAHWEGGVHVQLARLPDPDDQLVDRNLPQDFAG